MIMKTRLIVIAALCGALLCSCGNRNKKAQKESVYKETIELTTVEGDHNLEATRIKIVDSLVKDPKAGAVINERYTGMLPAAGRSRHRLRPYHRPAGGCHAGCLCARNDLYRRRKTAGDANI